MNDVFAGLKKWIKANKVTLNFDNTNFMKFCTTNKKCDNLSIVYVDKTIEEVETTKFLGLQVDNKLNWKTHIQYIIPKLSSACFAMRNITSLMKSETLKLAYLAYFHSIMSYGIIFWGNSTDNKKVFYIQKKIIRILAGTKRRASCRKLFKKFNILPLASEFLLSLLSFVVDNFETFQTNSDIRNISTRYKYNLHVPNTNLSKYQKGVYYSGIKLFNNLPPTIKSLNHDIKKFKPALKEYLLSHSFYSIEEFTLAKNSQLL
jgi:hypothetical protein